MATMRPILSVLLLVLLAGALIAALASLMIRRQAAPATVLA